MNKPLIAPRLILPNQRKVSGGKNLDGSYWLEIEGSPRVSLTPQQIYDISIGFLRALGFALELPENIDG